MSTGDGKTQDAELLTALEQFVVENDELLALEERIGRFNIFDALGIVRAEIRHSNFLAWLLDPNESHGQGALFLNAVLMDLLRQSPAELRPFSPVELDGRELRGVEVRREWRHIDILIKCDEPAFVVAIENKIDSGERPRQLGRYKKTVRESFGDIDAQFVYLTREGDEPTDREWAAYTYRDIHRILQRVRQTSETSIGNDVRTFLDHYLNLIGSRFMDDPKIDELCRTIYKNHRQALDLIFEYGGSSASRLIRAIEDMITSDNRFYFIKCSSQRLRFAPIAWQNLLPPVGQESLVGPTNWLQLVFRITGKACVLMCSVRPTTDSELRSKIIGRLTRDPSEFGLKSFFKNQEHIGSRYATVGRETALTWKTDEEPEEEKLISVAKKKLDQWRDRLAGVPDALRPIISEWNAKQGRNAV